MNIFWKFIFRCLVVVVTFLTIGGSVFAVSNGTIVKFDRSKVREIMLHMTPAQKVGQLFVVGFEGNDVSNDTEIYNLIYDNRVGGVMLRLENDNFSNENKSYVAISKLTNELQNIAWKSSADESDEVIDRGIMSESIVAGYAPLFLGFDGGKNSGGGYYDDIGLSSIPSAMAIGSTWNVNSSLDVGMIIGSELNSIGINLYVGHSLDVIDNQLVSSEIGYRDAFGGNPYWVGEMAKAFVSGIHQGSSGRVAFVGDSFPGLGATDGGKRGDISVVNKGWEGLLNFDLIPFRSLTGSGIGFDEVIDVLIPAQARYSALQGTLSIDTRPLGLDGEALKVLLDINELQGWREQGGIVMSTSLSGEGVRKFYDPTGNTFPAFEIARDAFLAGNDLLYIDSSLIDENDTQANLIVDTIQLFIKKYHEDTSFAEKVDSSVERIIALKLRMYENDLSIINVFDNDSGLDITDKDDKMFQVAREAVTLLSPSKSEFSNRVPRGPVSLDRIVIFSDVASFKQCSYCDPKERPLVVSFQDAINRLYGFEGVSQKSTYELFSYRFLDLYDYLIEETLVVNSKSIDDTEIKSTEIDEALSTADWLIFALGDMNQDDMDDNALKIVLAERPDILSDKKVIVFAMGAPYYLDATEVSQLTAYYGLYGRSDAFIEVAARVLFQEVVAHQSPPVSIDAVSYDLNRNLSADANQMFLVGPSWLNLETTDGELRQFNKGTTLNVKTSVLKDNNGLNVPDGTLVEFDAVYLSEGGIVDTFVSTSTVQGVALGSLLLDRFGPVEIVARSGQAISIPFSFEIVEADQVSKIVQDNVENSELMLSNEFESIELNGEELDSNAEIPLVVTAVPLDDVNVPDFDDDLEDISHLDPRDLLSPILGMIVLGAFGWSMTIDRNHTLLLMSRIKVLLYITIGVWIGYDYYALGLPVPEFLNKYVGLAPAILSWVGGIIGLLFGRSVVLRIE